MLLVVPEPPSAQAPAIHQSMPRTASLEYKVDKCPGYHKRSQFKPQATECVLHKSEMCIMCLEACDFPQYFDEQSRSGLIRAAIAGWSFGKIWQ